MHIDIDITLRSVNMGDFHSPQTLPGPKSMRVVTLSDDSHQPHAHIVCWNQTGLACWSQGMGGLGVKKTTVWRLGVTGGEPKMTHPASLPLKYS